MRHPTVQVPNIGPMDHAWDLLGEWQAEFELPETESPVSTILLQLPFGSGISFTWSRGTTVTPKSVALMVLLCHPGSRALL